MPLWKHRWREVRTADLRILGLARRAGKVEIGEEAVGKAARGGKVRLILLAADASQNAAKRAEGFSFTAKAPVMVLEVSKGELGHALGLTGPAMAAITDTGLAAALAGALAGENTERYGETALSLKAQAEAEKRMSQKKPGRRRETNR